MRSGLLSISANSSMISLSSPVLRGELGRPSLTAASVRQEDGHRNRAFAVEAQGQVIALAGFEFHPGTPVWMSFASASGRPVERSIGASK